MYIPLQFANGSWYITENTPYVFLHTQTNCWVMKGYNVSDKGFNMGITETILDGSVVELCSQVTQKENWRTSQKTLCSRCNVLQNCSLV